MSLTRAAEDKTVQFGHPQTLPMHRGVSYAVAIKVSWFEEKSARM
jgi:hypothetical protein